MLDRTIRWQRLDVPGLEHCRIRQADDTITIRSLVIGEDAGQPFVLHYAVTLDTAWQFRSLDAERDDGQSLALSRDDTGRWAANGVDRPDLSACRDIDISGTPFTNSLPIRRARLDPGIPERFEMAYIPLDTLHPFADGQIYTRLGTGLFRYQAADRSFEATLAVDDDGLVIDYPPFWQRI